VSLPPTASAPVFVERRTRPLGLLLGVACGFASIVFLAGSACFQISSLEPSQGAALGQDGVCTVHFRGLPLHASVRVDGHSLESSLDLTRSTLTSKLGHLSDGQHQLDVELDSALVKDEQTVSFTVDTTPPRLAHLQPRSGGVTQDEATNIAGQTEPGAKVSVEDAEGHSLDLVQADSEGAFVARVQLADGANKLTLAAVDRAGNRSHTAWEIFADRQPPALSLVVAPPIKGSRSAAVQENQALRVDTLEVGVTASDDDRIARCRWSLDEGPSSELKLLRRGSSKGRADNSVFASAPQGRGSSLGRADNSVFASAPQGRGSSWVGRIALKDLAEGNRCLNVTVTDRSGRVAQELWHFNVDSTEEFGRKTMTRGAKGKDVKALQKRLAEAAGADTGEPGSGVYDEETEEAVRSFQSQQGIEPVDGVVGPKVLAALGPRIFVNISRLQLVLDRPGNEPRRYRIACGMDGHGTPTGKFRIVDKEANPPWLPPPSPWAKGAKVIPPGPGNPLGTRWLGLDHGGVGIHGTNAPWSIGSRSSHGCIRMTIPDIENLYANVDTGIPVYILASEKSDPAAQKYWP
jgi:lipoprotein-anchoring transpeptidase ErfK/SrfK